MAMTLSTSERGEVHEAVPVPGTVRIADGPDAGQPAALDSHRPVEADCRCGGTIRRETWVPIGAAGEWRHVPKVFYLLVCWDCGDHEHPLPIPFGSPAERGKWAGEHTRATGHDNWRVWDETRST